MRWHNNINHNALVQLVLQWLQYQPGVMAWPQGSTGVWDAKKGIYRKPTSKFHRNGVPDVLCVWRGIFVGIECKTGSGKLSDDQKQFRSDLIRAGGIYIECRKLQDVIDVFNQGNPYQKLQGLLLGLYLGASGFLFRHRAASLHDRSSPTQRTSVPCSRVE